MWGSSQESSLLILDDITAEEKALLARQLDPLDPALVGGVVGLNKGGDIVKDIRGHFPKAIAELLLLDVGRGCISREITFE